MKTQYIAFPRLILFFIAVTLALLIMASPGFADMQPKKIVIVPFKINAPQKMEYLKSGITDMLTSRIAWENKVTVVGREETIKALGDVTAPLNEGTAREIGHRLSADYVLFGSLTVFGNSISIDAKVVDASGIRSPLTFFNQSKGIDEVVPKINLFAEDINRQLFQRAMPTPRASAPAQSQQPDIYKHPEKLLQEGGVISEGERSLGVDESGRARIHKSWKSRNFKYLINGVATGDVNSDGKNEIVIATPHFIRIFGYAKRRLFEIATLAESGQNNYIGVDVADINDNGTAEIFITSQTMHKDKLTSFVLEYNGKNFAPIVTESSWYYRVLETPQRGKILFGQRGILSDPYAGDIFELSWDGGDYLPQDQIPTPRNINLMGYASGDVMNDGDESAVAYDENDRLIIINAGGKEEWKGSERLGGSMLYVSGEITELEQRENRRYLPMRILVHQNPASGKNEIIAAVNYELTGGHLRLRKFLSSRIESFTWHGLGVEGNWRTRKLSGQVRDIYIADFDHDGNKELLVALVLKEGSIAFTEKKSALVAYDLE